MPSRDTRPSEAAPTALAVDKRSLLALVAVALAAPGCAYRTIEAGCNNVPNPVLLSTVDRVRGHKPADAAPVGRVEVEVAETRTATSRREGNYQVTRVHTTREGANKASFAVISATQGKKDLDVRVASATAGAYVLAPLVFVRAKTWVGVDGDVKGKGAQ